MNDVLYDYLDKFIIVYLDDITISNDKSRASSSVRRASLARLQAKARSSGGDGRHRLFSALVCLFYL
jgi:hypothetical protein